MEPDRVIILAGHSLILCPEGYELYIRFDPYWMINKKSDRCYLYCSHADFKNKPFHRLLLNEPVGDVDHRNGNGLDNRLSNLRIATRQQNSFNSKLRSNNLSGYKGVSFCKTTGKWVARILINGTYRNLGRFNTPELAHEAYCIEGKLYMQEFFCDGTRA